MFDELRLKTKELRNFNASSYIEKKVKAINRFFELEGLDSVVIGISGGIDSAVTYRLLEEAHLAPNSPLKVIQPVNIPIYGQGITEQHEASYLAENFIKGCKTDFKLKTIHATKACKELIYASGDVCMTDWARGQLSYMLRSPILYYQAAILQDLGYKSIIAGTINRDEGSYVGMFGKFSDASTDLQILGDLHKSEVYEVAHGIGNIPDSIYNATPKGNVWDKKTDEELMGGVSYEFLEMYLLVKEYNVSLDGLTNSEKNEYIRLGVKIENLRNINNHKYKNKGCGFARFVDVMNRKIPGGWS